MLRLIANATASFNKLLLLACLLIVSSAVHGQVAPVSPEVTAMKLGDSASREIAGGDTHSYSFELSANEFVHVRVEQQGGDVATLVQGPDGVKSPEVDRPNGTRGRDSFSWVSTSAGNYVLKVRSTQPRAIRGRYSLTVEDIRPVQQNDLTRIEAEQIVSKGEILRFKGDSESLRLSIEEFRKAATLWNKVADRYEEATALYGSGFVLLGIGENPEAIRDLNRAIELFGNDIYGRAITSAALGFPLMYLGDTVGAMKTFELALEVARPAESIRVEGVALYGLGWSHALRGEYAKALTRFNESLKIRLQAKDVRGEALTLAGIGKVEALMGNKANAREFLKRALDRLPKSRDTFAEGDILSNLGWVARDLNEDELALDYFKRALPLRQGDLVGEATTLYGISTISQRLGLFEQSIKTIEDALKIIESQRTRGLNQQLRLSYFASIQDYYDFYIYLLMKLDRQRPGQGYATKALHVCERARARGLIDLLAENQIDLRHGVDASLLTEERRIDKELSTLLASQYQQPNNLSTPPTQLLTLTRQLESVRAQIREASPNYAAIVQPQPLTAAQIQKEVLDKDTVLLEYALGEDESYLWVVTVQDVFSFRLPRRSMIEREAKLLNEMLRSRNQEVRDESPTEKRARIMNADVRAKVIAGDLGRMLLAPLSGRFFGKRFLIVAPDALQYVPFAALTYSTDQSSPLIVNHELVVLPSATAISVLRSAINSRTPQPNSVIAFGDPVFGPDDERVAGPIAVRQEPKSRAVGSRESTTPPNTANETNFPRLLSSRWEARRIVEIANAKDGSLLLDFEANRHVSTISKMSQFRFIHFATHAIVNNENPELSGIVLSLIDKTGRSQVGFLSSHEIFDLKLPAELVVLSACRTGLGKEFKGEGLIGLTRAFVYAGAARIVVSIWDVDDKPTAELMVRFYRHMFGPKKLQPAAALRAAQLELLQDPRWRSPYFWAAFMLQGEWK